MFKRKYARNPTEQEEEDSQNRDSNEELNNRKIRRVEQIPPNRRNLWDQRPAQPPPWGQAAAPTMENESTTIIVQVPRQETPGARPFWVDRKGRQIPDSVSRKMTRSKQREWLDSSINWKKSKLGRHWKGVKVLGIGGYGLVGLWKSLRVNSPREVKEVVVKQSKKVDKYLAEESRLLQLCKDTGTKHIVKILRTYFTEAGQGTSEWDRQDIEISRIYLEYCNGGDMTGFMRLMYDRFTKENPMDEELVWRVWECLARGLCVLAYGNEELSSPKWQQEIGHFDIKPQNILLGDYDEKHEKTKIFKIADLGMAMQIPEPQTPEFWVQVAWRGTAAYHPPEQVYNNVPNLTFGTPGNVWQIAKCMYVLICRGRSFGNILHTCDLFDDQPKFETFGEEIRYMKYSNTLIGAVLWCLAFDPSRRPTPRQLLKMCQTAISSLDEQCHLALSPDQNGGTPGNTGPATSLFHAVNSESFSSIHREPTDPCADVDMDERQVDDKGTGIQTWPSGSSYETVVIPDSQPIVDPPGQTGLNLNMRLQRTPQQPDPYPNQRMGDAMDVDQVETRIKNAMHWLLGPSTSSGDQA